MQDIDIYYESTKQVYEQIAHWPERKRPLRQRAVDWLVALAVIAFFLSLIPILPVIVVFAGAQLGWVLGPINLQQGTIGEFIIVWVSSALGTAAILVLMVWLDARVGLFATIPEGPPQTLSPDQLTFISIYEAYKELKIYFVSHIDQHVDSSLAALKRFLPPEKSRIEFTGVQTSNTRPDLAELQMLALVDNRGPTSLSRQISIAKEFLQAFEKSTWLQIDTATKSTLHAFISFPDKVFYRLSKRDDLPSVLSVLENLMTCLSFYDHAK